MNLLSIVITNMIGVLLILVLFLNGYRMLRNRKYEMRLFSIMLWLILSSCLAEMSSFLIDGKLFAGACEINFLLNTYLYLSNACYTVTWIKFVDYKLNGDYLHLNRKYNWLHVLLGITLVLVAANMYGHFLFYVDSANVYHRTPLSYLFLILPVLGQVYAVWLVHHFQKEAQGLKFFPIWSFLFPFSIGVIVQAAVYGISIAWCGAAIGMCSLYMSLQNQLIYDDTLTGLYNRYYLSEMLASKSWKSSEKHAGIMMDVDYFKEINDTWGHSRGDEALKDLAEILRKSIPANAIPIRYAGDEFIILLMTNDPAEIAHVSADIDTALQAFNASKVRPYQLSVSMGTAVYRAEAGAEDRFLEAMDRCMYETKEQRHRQHSQTDAEAR